MLIQHDLARHLVRQNGCAALRIVQGLIAHAVKIGDQPGAEVWRSVEALVQTLLRVANDNES
jgi:hypothetical protein